MKKISFRFPTSVKDVRVLWKEYTSRRYRHNADVMRKLTNFYISNVLRGRWGEVADGKVISWNDNDKRQFEREMCEKCNEYIHYLME